MYGVNIIGQAVFCLITPASLAFCVAWLFIKKAGTPEWLYAIFIPAGIIAGLVSMVRFVILATGNLERLEKQPKNNSESGHNKNEK